MKPKLSDIVKILKQKANTSDTLYVDDLKSARLRAYRDSLNLYNEGNRTIPKNAFNFRKYVPFKSSVEVSKINGISNYSGNVDPFAKEKIKPVRQYDFIASDTESYNNGEYFPPVENARKTRFLYKKPVQPVKYKKSEPKKPETKKEESAKKSVSKPVEKKQNVYEGSPVYSPGAGSGMPSALVGFRNKSGDTTYIQPEDYERFAVPKYGKAFIESKSKKK